MFCTSSRSRNPKSAPDGEKWSGDATKFKTFGYTESSITVSMNEEQKQVREAPKQQPIWMSKSTVDGIPLEEDNEVIVQD